jgi:hypothetical protein
MQVIVFQSGESASVIWPTNGVESAMVAVPAESPHRVIDSGLLPPDYRDALVADFSSEDDDAFLSIDPAKKAEIDKQRAIDEVEVWWNSAIAEGFTTAGGWTLGLTVSDVTLLTGNYVLAREADALGLPLPPVIDRDGTPHALAGIEELTSVMLAYGQYRAELSAEYAARLAALQPS